MSQSLRLVVLTPIHLDHKLQGMTVEVDDVRPDLMLTTKFQLGKAMGAQALPEPKLGITGGLSEFLAALDELGHYPEDTAWAIELACRRARPLPNPLPGGEGITRANS
jgi:hypothetical protein